ncbi:hypothetical protein LBMAG56_01750 [Verrucomicrobiota bacterium]|nr:hypothetical protein LBMAG56_01750 [Verrucomicrobiota bacterium]
MLGLSVPGYAWREVERGLALSDSGIAGRADVAAAEDVRTPGPVWRLCEIGALGREVRLR